VLGLISSNVKF